MDRWTRYLYEQHSEDELREWASRLNMFRYFRAYGGHANDADSLDVAFAYENEEMLLEILEESGLQPTVYSTEPPQPVPGKSYGYDEFKAFVSLVPNTRWIEQPGHCEIFKTPVFIWCENDVLTISVSPGSYSIEEKHIQAAETLEAHLKDLGRRPVDPPRDTNHYICPKYYPDFFKGGDPTK